MKLQLFAASVLALAATGPVLSQVDEEAERRLVPPAEAGGEAEAEIGTVLGTGALPGVGIGTTTTTETGLIGGPGGIQGGVGAAGAIAPGLSGAPGGPGPEAGSGVPLETAPAETLVPPAN